jgi:hypothetical protein
VIVNPWSKKWKPEDFKYFTEEEFILSQKISIAYQDIQYKRWAQPFAEYLLSKSDLTNEDMTISYVV